MSLSLGLFVGLISAIIAVQIANSILEDSEAAHYYASIIAKRSRKIATSKLDFYHSLPWILSSIGFILGFVSGGGSLGKFIFSLTSAKVYFYR